VERYYDLVDVFVYPRLPMRLTELVTPLKPLEAMARGRIVAASNVGGHRELIQDGKTGFLFSPDNPEALAEALLNIIRRRVDWPEIRMVARQFVEQERTWARSVDSYREVYDTVTTGFRKIKTTQPRLLVVSTLFPHLGQPVAGVFIRERMFRVGKHLPLVVMAPTPWFPGQDILRYFRPHFRPSALRREIQDGIEIYRPRFLSVPALFKWLDGWSLAITVLLTLRRLHYRFDLIDAHFAYPEGYAAALLGKWLGLPVTITLRGTEIPISRFPFRRRLMLKALESATRVFAVAASLERHVTDLGADPRKIRVVGNGVDTEKFHPVPQAEARHRLGLPADGPILISVGGLVERKGFHRVIELLPALKHKFPGLRYLIVGGPGPAGDMSQYLRQQVRMLKLEEAVHFLGVVSPEDLKWPLSAADVFVLATRSEGWANVLLEALACGLPVITTDVGGNREVISNPQLGTIVPFGDSRALEAGIYEALIRSWDRAAIRAYACENHWDRRVEVLIEEFVAISAREGVGEGIMAVSKEFRS
jgi:glycosyltransferase involved in cell wall biosynthesis